MTVVAAHLGLKRSARAAKSIALSEEAVAEREVNKLRRRIKAVSRELAVLKKREKLNKARLRKKSVTLFAVEQEEKIAAGIDARNQELESLRAALSIKIQTHEALKEIVSEYEKVAVLVASTDAAVDVTLEKARSRKGDEMPTAKKAVAKKAPTKKKAVTKKAPAKKAAAKRKAVAKKAPAKKAVAKKKTVAKKAPAKKTAAKKKVAAKKAPAKKVVAKKKAPAKKKAVAKKAPAKKRAVAKKAPAKKSPAKKKVVAKKAPAKKTAAKKARAKR